MMLAALDPTFVLANRAEAVLWFCIAIGFAIHALLRPRGERRRRGAWIAGCAFAAFGASDLVEATTGAWWRPWWLLAWKGACVVLLLALLVRHVRRAKGAKGARRAMSATRAKGARRAEGARRAIGAKPQADVTPSPEVERPVTKNEEQRTTNQQQPAPNPR